jgi:sec-independent protein translocase protein TatA
MEFFSPGHLIPLVIVALVLFFGWKQLPDMARSLGRSLRVFKTEIKGMSQDDKDRADAAEKPAEPPRALPPAQIVRNDTPAKARPRPTPHGTARSDSPRTGA